MYRGDFIAWQGGCLLIGAGSGSIAPHAHYAIQIVLGSSGGLRVQCDDTPWQAAAAAIIPSRAPHSIDISRCAWSAVLFVEPETLEGRALTVRIGTHMAVLADQVVAQLAWRLEQAWREQRSSAAVELACRAIVQALAPTPVRAPSDPRVLAAISWMQQRIDSPLTLAQVAAAVHLSPGRFRHLFVAETGMPWKTYVLWRRMVGTWQLLVRGMSLSEAAHAQGFSDSAHLSRTARRMFGIAPSMLQLNGSLSRSA